LPRIAVDLTALRESRDFRLLALGQLVSNVGSEAAMVALPYQVFVLTHSAALVGLIGAVELGPLMIVSLLGGAWADRADRRLLLALAQIGVMVSAGALAALAILGDPPVIAIFALAGLLAGSAALDTVVRAAIVPSVAGSRLRSALSVNYGLYQLTQIIGPAIGGLMIAAVGLGAAYAFDAASCLAMVAAALAMSPKPPQRSAAGEADAPEPVLRSIAEGLRFVRRSPALLGSFAIDLVAMTFGMPRALFAILSLTVYHAGATGVGALYAAVALGATIAVATTGWIEHAQRLGRITIVAVLVWGAAIAGAGAAPSLLPAMALLALAGAADSVSAVCRTTINQLLTPEQMRGRMSSVYSLVVRSGPRLGDIESGLVASATSAQISVVSGGLICIVGVGAILLAFPALAAFHGLRDAVEPALEPAGA
jgi:MFS family permease